MPVVVLADVSGSMRGEGKLAALNTSIAEMIDAFRQDSIARGTVQMAVVAFSGETAQRYVDLTPVNAIEWQEMTVASGLTPLHLAIDEARHVLEERVEARSLKPLLILTSDGRPNSDEWRQSLDALLATPLGKDSQRFAVAIGADADRQVLEAFVGDRGHVLEAHAGDEVVEYFRRLTLTVTRSLSVGRQGEVVDDNFFSPPPAA